MSKIKTLFKRIAPWFCVSVENVDFACCFSATVDSVNRLRWIVVRWILVGYQIQSLAYFFFCHQITNHVSNVTTRVGNLVPAFVSEVCRKRSSSLCSIICYSWVVFPVAEGFKSSKTHFPLSFMNHLLCTEDISLFTVVVGRVIPGV